MLSSDIASSFKTLADHEAVEAVRRLVRRAASIRGEFHQRGAYASSGHLSEQVTAAIAELEASAANMFRLLLEANGAEPPRDKAERIGQLSVLLEEALQRVAQRIEAQAAASIGPISAQLGNKEMLRGLDTLPAVRDRLCAKYLAQLRVAISTLANTGHFPASVANVINVAGSVGFVQTGQHATSHIGQQVVQHGDLAAVREALDLVLQALREQAAAGQDRAEVIEAVEDLRAEAARDKPNRFRVAGLVSAAGATIQTIADVRGAWEQVQEWARFLAG